MGGEETKAELSSPGEEEQVSYNALITLLMYTRRRVQHPNVA
jgi:hypothetical protein